jgi:LysM repeat protein
VVAAGSLRRYAAPAAFLLAATLLLLVVRAMLDDEPARATVPSSAARAVRPADAKVRKPAKPRVQHAIHVIQTGETLGAVAEHYRTSVTELLELNPGIDPAALQVGQQVRVK